MLVTSAFTWGAGLSGGAMGAYLVNRTTRTALRLAVEQSERVAADGSRAARETLMRSSALELLRAAARVPQEVAGLGVRVTRDDRKRGFAFLDTLRVLGHGPAYLTPPVLQERWATLVELVHTFAYAWPVLDPEQYGGDSLETQLAAGGWLPEIYMRGREDVEAYATFVVATAVSVVQDTEPPTERPRPLLGPAQPPRARDAVHVRDAA